MESLQWRLSPIGSNFIHSISNSNVQLDSPSLGFKYIIIKTGSNTPELLHDIDWNNRTHCKFFLTLWKTRLYWWVFELVRARLSRSFDKICIPAHGGLGLPTACIIFSWIRLQRAVVGSPRCICRNAGISGGIARIAPALPGILRSEEPSSPAMPSIPGIPARRTNQPGLLSTPPPPRGGQAC